MRSRFGMPNCTVAVGESSSLVSVKLSRFDSSTRASPLAEV